ncbi:signal peptidase II [Candidatus Shapirobacteria bacterium]|nr:signal peptidase II [Candidatus Shapirobacteria bacterium]
MNNFGISFGWYLPWVMLINSIVLLALIWWWWKNRIWGIMLIILGGGLNLVDRFRFGYVRDYWQIPGTLIYNNFNDWLIFAGVVIVIWKLWRKR